MPQTPDLSDIFGKPSTPSSSSTDLSDIFGGKSTTPTGASPVPASTQSTTDLSDIFGGDSRPDKGQPATAPTHAYQDPSKSWWERGFDWANTPITTSLFGMPEERQGAGGVERGAEHIISGLTSPLSLALGAATFGTGGFLTSAGETALKEATLAGGEAAFSADEIAQIAKGSKAALEAYHSVPSTAPVIREALEAGGHDLGLLQKAREAIGPVDHDMELGSPEIQSHLARAGFDEDQLKALAQTGETIKGAVEGFKPVEDAVRAAGVDPDLLKRGQDFLHDNGMDEASLLGGDAIDRGAFQVLHHIAPDISLGTTLKAARTAKTLMETGFTLQQLEGAAAMSPRFFDALKEGDYDKAAEYGTEWAANAVLGVAGASHALHAWGELAEPILGAKLKPSDEQLRVNNLNGVREAERAVGDQQGLDVHKEIKRLLGHEPPRPILGDTEEVKAQKQSDEMGTTFLTEMGGDAEKAAWYRDNLIRAEGGAPEPRPLTGLPTGRPLTPTEVPSQAGTKVLFSNANGEVRVGADGRPVVWMSPEARTEFETEIGHKFGGVNYSQAESDQLIARLKSGHPTGDLFKAAQNASKQGTSAAIRPGSGVLVVGEELHHTWQRELSKDQDITNHLDGATRLPDGTIKVTPGSQWDRLNGIIPKGVHDYMANLGYSEDPVTRVTETAAKFRAGRVPEGVTPEEAIKWLSEYEKEVKAKHGEDSYEPAERINEVARQHLEDINAARESAGNTANQGAGSRIVGGAQEGTRGVRGVVPEEPSGVRGETPEGLKALESEEEPYSFVSPNVYKIGNVSEAARRLDSRSQKIAEKLSEDLSTRLGIKAVVRPSIGHWEGGAENSMISRFAPGTDPEAVEYHNAILGKVNRQNAGVSFIPDPKGPDQAYQFRVPSSVADPKVIARLLEEHGISGSSIEPVAGGHNVIITSPGGELRGAVSELANRLKATQVEEHNGTQTTLGDWNDRDAASTVYDTRIRELEAKHPEWGKVRSQIESSPDYNTLSKLVREAEDKVKGYENASPFLTGVHGSRTANITELNPEFAGKGPQGGAEMARAKNFPDDFVKRSYLRLEGAKNEPFYDRLPYQYRAVLNSENLYNWAEDRDGLLAKAEKEAAVRKMDTQPGAVGTIYERMMKDAGYDGYYHPGANQIGVFKNTPVEKALKEGTSPLSPKPELPKTVGTAAGAKADTNFFAQAKAELGTDNISAIAKRAQELKEAARPENGLFSKERPVNGLPDNLEEMLADNKFKDKPEDYRKNVINWFDRIAKGDIPENVKSAYQYMRQIEDRNWEIAHANALIKEYTENHIHRYFEDNPQGRLVVADAKSGKFATNVTAAQHRTYDTLMTALLKDPRQLQFDPAKATSLDRAEIVKASANRKFISQLMSSGLRASDGRPVAFLNGAGNVVAGENGKDPKTFVDPNRIRKINIDDKTVAHLTQTGDLQRFVDDGTIKDITPYIHPDNMGAAIDRLENEAVRKVDNATYDEQGNNVLLEKVRQLKQMQETKDFSGLKEMNEQQPKVYAWSPQGYVALDHNAMRGWNFVTNSPDGNQVLVNSDIMTHPEYAEYLKNRLGLEKGALSGNPIGRTVLGVGKAAKETLLSLSPFHLVQLGLRSIMTGINPFTLEAPDIENGAKIDPSDPNSPTKIKKMVEQGLTTGRDYRSMQAYTEGNAASGEHNLLRRVPVVGPILADTMQWQTDFLFKRAAPAWKAVAAEKLFDDYKAKYPEWSVDKIARAAASHANDTFGGINWKAMGRNASSQEFARAILLAPDWLESELRSGARLFNKDEGAIGRRQVVIMAGSVYLMARALNALTTGNPHYEAPFSLATKSKDGKETLWGIRMLPSDLLSAASSPSSFIKGRLSPGVGLATEALTGRDKMGRKMQPQDLWADATRQLLPIPIQSLGEAITNTGPQVGNAGQAWKAIGGTARSYSTPAAQKAVELAANHNEDGFVDPVQQARHREVMSLGDRLRSGDIAWPDLVKMTYGTSQLTEAELRKIQNNYKATQNMPADIAHLYSRASRLPAKEFLDVWDTANITEQKALQPLMVQTQKKYLRKAAKDLTPDQRQQDPTFQRLLKMAMGEPAAQNQ